MNKCVCVCVCSCYEVNRRLFSCQVRKPGVYICTKDHPSEQGEKHSFVNVPYVLLLFFTRIVVKFLDTVKLSLYGMTVASGTA